MSASERVPVSGRLESAPWWPVFAVLGALWFFAVRQLRFDWTINPQYTYGWTVPFLSAYLFAERWKRRPPAQEKPVGALHHPNRARQATRQC